MQSPIEKTTNPNIPRPPFENMYAYALVAMLAFFTADAVVTYSRSQMLPSQTSRTRPQKPQKITRKTKSDYVAITDRNIFNADGEIPPALADPESGNAPGFDDNTPPVLSQLPLTLIGTIVHVDQSKSVATVQNKSNQKIQSYKISREIEGIAKITAIERKKLIFRNLSNNRKEYIEIKDDLKVNFGLKEKTASNDSNGIKQSGNNFSLKRELVDKATSNLPELLQQARAVPNIIPNSGGRVEGFRILDMEEGSLFESLGLQVQDVIKGVNGEPVDSPAKAMELYNALKTSNRIDIEIERNGRSEQFNYTID